MGVVVVVGFVTISFLFLIIAVINGWVLLNIGVGLGFVLEVGFFCRVGLGVVGLFLGIGGRPPWSGPPWNCGESRYARNMQLKLENVAPAWTSVEKARRCCRLA